MLEFCVTSLKRGVNVIDIVKVLSKKSHLSVISVHRLYKNRKEIKKCCHYEGVSFLQDDRSNLL